jgi:iron complex transport system substrate-binding protein
MDNRGAILGLLWPTVCVLALLALVAMGNGCADAGPVSSAGGQAPSAAAPSASEAAREERLVVFGAALTEALFGMGLGSSVVGVDAGTQWPEEVQKLPQVGHRHRVSPEAVLALKPTRILASASFPEEALAPLRSAGVEVVVVEGGEDLAGAKARIERLGALFGRPEQAHGMVSKIDQDLSALSKEPLPAPPRVLFVYARGMKTLLVAGRGTGPDAMIGLVGGVNAADALDGFKPLTAEAVLQARPEVLVMPEHGWQSLGGVDGVLALPGVADTPAGRARAIVTLDDQKLLGFGPRVGEAALELRRALAKAPREAGP